MRTICNHFIEVRFLAWPRIYRDDLSLSILIDNNVGWLHVTNLAVVLFVLFASTNNVVQEIPHFSFEEGLVDLCPVLYFTLQEEQILFEHKLNGK